MQIFLKILYVVLASFLTIIVTLNLKGRLFQYDNGWDGIAAMLGALIISAVLGLVGAIYSLRWINKEKMPISLLIITILIFAVIGFHWAFPIKKQVGSQRIEKIEVEAPKFLGRSEQ